MKIEMADEGDMVPSYSGQRSAEFWNRVNRLDKRQGELYSLGVALQNHEGFVLKMLSVAELQETEDALEEEESRFFAGMEEALDREIDEAVYPGLDSLIANDLSCWRDGGVTSGRCLGYENGMLRIGNTWHNISSFDRIEVR